MNVLITGGAGFIGSTVALRLVGLGHRVTVLDALTEQIHGPDPTESPLVRRIADHVRLVRGCVTNRDVWPDVLEGQDVILHLAAETGTGQSMYDIRRYSDVNVGGTAELLEQIAKRSDRPRRLVLASTRALYGEGRYRDAEGNILFPEERRKVDLDAGRFEPLDVGTGQPLVALPTDEQAPVSPRSVYGVSKACQESLVRTVCPSLGVASTALRYQNVYGPGQALSNPYTGILSVFSTRIRHGLGLSVYEDGLATRDFVFIDDVADATVRAVLDEGDGDHVIGIGSGVGTTILEAANTLVAAFGADVELKITGEYRAGDIRHNAADLTRAASVLGYRPEVGFREGIARFVEWVETQPLPEDRYEKSVDELRRRGLMGG